MLTELSNISLIILFLYITFLTGRNYYKTNLAIKFEILRGIEMNKDLHIIINNIFTLCLNSLCVYLFLKLSIMFLLLILIKIVFYGTRLALKPERSNGKDSYSFLERTILMPQAFDEDSVKLETSIDLFLFVTFYFTANVNVLF